MSYRTYVNDTQIFGNNECYHEWIEFIKSQGIEVDDDSYVGEITDFMGALETIEKIVMRLEKDFQEKKKSDCYYEDTKIQSLFDFSNIMDELENQVKITEYRPSLFDKLVDSISHGYAFMPYAFYLACVEMIEPSKEKVKGHIRRYKLKDGETIKVSAF